MANIWWYYFKRNRKSGQVATLITLLVAIIFLFVAVTMNIGRLSYKKTVTANAADGGAMKLASYIGSYANLLSKKYVKGKDEYCKRSYGNVFFIIAVIVTIVTWGAGSGIWAVVYAGMQIAGLALSAYNMIVLPGKIVEKLNRELSKLSLDANLNEQAMMYALSYAIDDPNKVVDIHDYDEDMDTTDKIPAFASWYTERVMSLVAENTTPEVRQAIADLLTELGNFANEANDFRINFTEDETRPLVVEDCENCDPDEDSCDCSEDEPVVLQYAEGNGELVLLLEDLEDAGYNVSFWLRDADAPEKIDEVDDLSSDLFSFVVSMLGYEGGGMLNQNFDLIVASRRDWRKLLYSEEAPEADEEQTWYDIWAGQIGRIENWELELQNILAALNVAPPEEGAEEEAGPTIEELIDRTTAAIDKLTEFRQKLIALNDAIQEYYYNTIEDEPEISRDATYSWHDSLGWHHVYVEVSKFTLPTVKVEKHSKWYGKKICVVLKPSQGDVRVDVKRYDQSTSHSYFARGRTPWWRFRYVKDAALPDAPEVVDPTVFDPGVADQALAYGMHSVSVTRWFYNTLPRVVRVE